MAKKLFYMSQVQTTDAEFRLWGKAISDALTDIGIPKTADTGQIDWTTVAKPATSNTSQGYEIRYLNDSLHGTNPVYIKIEWGSGSGSGANPGLWVTTGSITNGAGTLSGDTTARYQITHGASVPTASPVFASAYASGFAMVWDPLVTGSGQIFSVERCLDQNGDIVSSGVNFVAKSHIYDYVVQDTSSTGSPGTQYQGVSASLPKAAYNVTNASMNPGNRIPFAPVRCWTPQGLRYTRKLVACPSPSVTVGGIYYFERFGVTKKYMSTGVLYFGIRNNSSDESDPQSSCMIEWED